MQRWRSRPADELALLEFDDDFVAFHRPSGKTHLLNAASHFLIFGILAEARDFDTIAEMVADGAGTDDEFVARLAAMLERFEDLGMVERCD